MRRRNLAAQLWRLRGEVLDADGRMPVASYRQENLDTRILLTHVIMLTDADIDHLADEGQDGLRLAEIRAALLRAGVKSEDVPPAALVLWALEGDDDGAGTGRHLE